MMLGLEYDEKVRVYTDTLEDFGREAGTDVFDKIRETKKDSSFGEWEYIIKPKIQSLLDE